MCHASVTSCTYAARDIWVRSRCARSSTALKRMEIPGLSAKECSFRPLKVCRRADCGVSVWSCDRKATLAHAAQSEGKGRLMLWPHFKGQAPVQRLDRSNRQVCQQRCDSTVVIRLTSDECCAGLPMPAHEASSPTKEQEAEGMTERWRFCVRPVSRSHLMWPCLFLSRTPWELTAESKAGKQGTRTTSSSFLLSR